MSNLLNAPHNFSRVADGKNWIMCYPATPSLSRHKWRTIDVATHACAIAASELTSPSFGVVPKTWRSEMAWKAPKIVEVPVGMEINMYACAARK
jgi:coenzyme PQQ precursor peptide PqqA